MGNNTRIIIIEPYNPAWPQEFARIKAHIWPHISGLALGMVHVGSTSVPNLPAKPIIDIDIIIQSYVVLPQIVDALDKLGYEHRGDLGIATREAFQRPVDSPFMAHHTYVCPQDSPELARHRFFSEYLRQNPVAAAEYAALKQGLAQRYPNDIDAYVDGKTEFIQKILHTGGLT